MLKNNQYILILVGAIILSGMLPLFLFTPTNEEIKKNNSNKQRDTYIEARRLELCTLEYGKDFTEIMFVNFVSPKCYNPITQETKEIPKNNK